MPGYFVMRAAKIIIPPISEITARSVLTLVLPQLNGGGPIEEEREDILWRSTERLFKLGEGVN